MNEDCVLPPWLHDILLGYGDPGAAQYRHMDGCLQTVDFKDTFLDAGGWLADLGGSTVSWCGVVLGGVTGSVWCLRGTLLHLITSAPSCLHLSSPFHPPLTVPMPSIFCAHCAYLLTH
jgi:hypothetical protein